ncbi:MAG: flippase-like domain-containing protein [Acidobacteria bacterium]|nr:flippase-like domain-containing protein [Acidobacteriota bacterium]
MRRFMTWVSGPLIAALFLWLTFRGADVGELMRRIGRADPWLLLFLVGTVFGHFLLRALRWRTMLKPVRADVPLGELFSAVTIGYMASALPGRVGEVLRPALLARRTGMAFAPVLGTVVAERAVLDTVGVVGAGAVGLMLPPALSGLTGADPHTIAAVRNTAIAMTAICVASFGLIFAVARWRGRTEAFLARHRGRVGRAVASFLGRLLPGLAAFGTAGGMFRLVLETIAIWAVIAAGTQAGIVACGVPLAPGGALVLTPLLALGVGVPTPAGAGTFHFAMKVGLMRLFGVSEEAALGAALVVHAASWLPVLAAGGLLIAKGALTRPDAVPEPGAEEAAL